MEQSERLTVIEARRSPCMSCNAPCCTHLPLHTFQMTNMAQLDHAIYMLNFRRIELGLSPSGDWSVYYRYPCRHFDRNEKSCTIHGKALQPNICVHFSPFSCWYKQAIEVGGTSPTFIRINRRRLAFIAEHIRFDEMRNIVDIPDWATMLDGLSDLPLDVEFDDASDEDPVFDQWLHEAACGVSMSEPRTKSYDQLRDPCGSCSAYCCKTLIFPQPPPVVRANLDYLQFVLGFPGLELGVFDGEWSIIVKSTCRHLVDNKCSVFGKQERPLLCRYYDASSCHYVGQFGKSRPTGFVRVRYEQFAWLTELVVFDDDGTVLSLPSTNELRDHVERSWNHAVAVAIDEERSHESE